MGSGTLTKLLMGVGLGILAVSCLASTVVYGRFANSFTQLKKLEMKVSFDGLSEVHSTSIAIAVLGCLSAVAAVGAIVLTILMENQTIVLIIVGGVSALFAFGCIVAEGVFTQKVVLYQAISDNENGHGYYIVDHSHKSAQKYIEKAIEQLYKKGVSNLRAQYGENDPYDKIPSYESVKLGKFDNDDRLITYNYIWKGTCYDHDDFNEDNVTLCRGSNYIYAYYNNKPTVVASIKFSYKEAVTPKYRICWYKKDKSDVECKNLKGDKITTDMEGPWSVSITDVGTLEEYIIKGDYISKEKAEKDDKYVDYKVDDFPVAYKLLNYKNYIDNKESYDDFGADSDDDHFKVGGPQYAKACVKDIIKSATKIDKDSFFIAIKEPSKYEDYIEDCDRAFKYFKKDDAGKDIDKDLFSDQKYNYTHYRYCGHNSNDIQYIYDSVGDYTVSRCDLGDLIYKPNFKDINKGSKIPKIRNYHLSQTRKYASEYWKYGDDCLVLYEFAIMSLVIQIVAIVIWAVGRFIGGFGGGGDDQKSPSEGEA